MLFAVLTASGLAAAALSFFLRNNDWVKSSSRKASESVSGTIRSERVQNILQNKYTRYASLLAFAAILIILPRTWGGYWNYVFGTVGIYIILGLGLNIITGWAGQLVIGYVAFFAIGAYTFALLTAPEPHHLMLNFWVALGLGSFSRRHFGLVDWSAHPELARRLPGNCDSGLC